MRLASPPHLLSIDDLSREELDGVLADAVELKEGWPGRPVGSAGALAGRSVALLFDKPSLRTRVSFEVGLARLGATTVDLNGSDVGLGSREPAEDMARTLGRYVDALVIRILSHETLETFARMSGVSVVNALTEREHPCQALADLLTLREHLGDLAGRQLVYVGDGNNVCHSLLLGGAALGLHVRVASPAGYEPDAWIVERARSVGRSTGARIEVVRDPTDAVAGADAVYTDVWASMGSEHQAAERRAAFKAYQVNRTLLRGAPRALVMHCLPAHRGEEIAAEVLESPQSVVFDQAENRMYVQQAVLLHLLSGPRRLPLRGRTAQPISVFPRPEPVPATG